MRSFPSLNRHPPDAGLFDAKRSTFDGIWQCQTLDTGLSCAQSPIGAPSAENADFVVIRTHLSHGFARTHDSSTRRKPARPPKPAVKSDSSESKIELRRGLEAERDPGVDQNDRLASLRQRLVEETLGVPERACERILRHDSATYLIRNEDNRTG
jgi:hypothetical protein